MSPAALLLAVHCVKQGRVPPSSRLRGAFVNNTVMLSLFGLGQLDSSWPSPRCPGTGLPRSHVLAGRLAGCIRCNHDSQVTLIASGRENMPLGRHACLVRGFGEVEQAASSYQATMSRFSIHQVFLRQVHKRFGQGPGAQPAAPVSFYQLCCHQHQIGPDRSTCFGSGWGCRCLL